MYTGACENVNVKDAIKTTIVTIVRAKALNHQQFDSLLSKSDIVTCGNRTIHEQEREASGRGGWTVH